MAPKRQRETDEYIQPGSATPQAWCRPAVRPGSIPWSRSGTSDAADTLLRGESAAPIHVGSLTGPAGIPARLLFARFKVEFLAWNARCASQSASV
jgi:hypothetical protein